MNPPSIQQLNLVLCAHGTDGLGIHVLNRAGGTPLGTLRISATKITLDDLACLRVDTHGPKGTSLNAFITTYAVFQGKLYDPSLLVPSDRLLSLYRAGLLTGGGKAMPAYHGSIETLLVLLYPDPCLDWVEHAGLLKGAGHLANPATDAD